MLYWKSCQNALLFAIVLLAVGCSSITNLNKTAGSVEPTGVQNDPDSLPTDDSAYARSPKRQVGAGFSFDIFGRNKKRSERRVFTDHRRPRIRRISGMEALA